MFARFGCLRMRATALPVRTPLQIGAPPARFATNSRPRPNRHLFGAVGTGAAVALSAGFAISTATARAEQTAASPVPSPATAKDDAIAIFHAALRAADPFVAVTNAIRLSADRKTLTLTAAAATPIASGDAKLCESAIDLSAFDRIIVVGAGKASVPMARGVEHALSQLTASHALSGHIVTKHEHAAAHGLTRITVSEGAHPVPDQSSVDATARMLAELSGSNDRTMLLVLISGGASALLAAPAEGISLSDLQRVNTALLQSGAEIQEMNAIRKHLSRVTGGRLAAAAYPATVYSLILSDVIGDPVDVIGSGPTVHDPSTFKLCTQIVEKYRLKDKLPASVIERLYAPNAERDETPKAGDIRLSRSRQFIVGSNRLAMNAASEEAARRGYTPIRFANPVSGEASRAGAVYAHLAHRALHRLPSTAAATVDETVSAPAEVNAKLDSAIAASAPVCIIAGGETTVTFTGSEPKGIRGGRNQELALAAAIALDRLQPRGTASRRAVILSAGTDGTDGPTPAAGAIIDESTVRVARERGLSASAYLSNHDSYHFFENAGSGLIVTGPTGTNVMDIALVVVNAKP